MKSKAAGLFHLRPFNQKTFYRDVLATLDAAKLRFLLGRASMEFLSRSRY